MYPRNMYRTGTDEFNHLKNMDSKIALVIKILFRYFKADKFDPKAWVEII